MKLPEFFQAPADPIVTTPIRIDESTTARQLTIRTILGAKSRTFPAAVLMIGHQVGEALVPVVMGLAIDRAIATRDGRELALWLVVLGIVFATLSFSFRFGTRLGLLGMQTVAHQLRTRVTDRILDPKGMSGPARLPGVSLSIATSDVQRLGMAIAIGVYPVGEIAAVLFCGIVLLWTSWQLGVAILVGAPIILWILDRAGGPLRDRSEREQELAARAAGTATDLVTGFRVVKGIGAEAEASRRYMTVSGQALKGVLRATRSEGIYLGAMELVSGLFIVGVAVAAASMAVSGSLSVGQLITVVGLTLYVMGPLGALASNAGTIWAGALASAGRVLDVLQAPAATAVGDTHDAPAGRVSFVGVSSGALVDFDLQLNADSMTAVVADADVVDELTAVLSRTREPEQGRVLVGENDLFDLTYERAAAAIRVAPHRAHLFEGTIVDNIAAGDSSNSGDRVTRAVFAAACDDIVESLPAGLDTQVGETGRLLSGGQRPRVALARALASSSDLLVLVEPTSAVDSVTESAIAERVAAARAGTATLIFTRSPALLAAADEVIVFRSGAVVYRGDSSGAAPTLDDAITEVNA